MENLWAESQGHWTCTAAPSKKWSPCQNICCVSHPGPSFLNRSVNLQPGQLLHYCVWRELEPNEDKKTELRQSVAHKMHTEAAREKETADMFTEVSLSHITPMRWVHHQRKSCAALRNEWKLWNMPFIWCSLSDAAEWWVTEPFPRDCNASMYMSLIKTTV